jgi:hypothetical protein
MPSASLRACSSSFGFGIAVWPTTATWRSLPARWSTVHGARAFATRPRGVVLHSAVADRHRTVKGSETTKKRLRRKAISRIAKQNCFSTSARKHRMKIVTKSVLSKGSWMLTEVNVAIETCALRRAHAPMACSNEHRGSAAVQPSQRYKAVGLAVPAMGFTLPRLSTVQITEIRARKEVRWNALIA